MMLLTTHNFYDVSMNRFFSMLGFSMFLNCLEHCTILMMSKLESGPSAGDWLPRRAVSQPASSLGVCFDWSIGVNYRT